MHVPLSQLARSAGLPNASIVLEALAGGGPSAALAPHREIYPASMIKVPIAAVLAALCEAGAYRPDDVATVDAASMTANDAPSPFVPGYAAELVALARVAISASDNVATNVLIETLGRETLTAACASLGLEATAVHRKLSGALPLIDDPGATGRNRHPAADAATLFRRIDADARRRPSWLHDALLAQIWNDKLSRGLEPGDAFAHKTGDTDEVSHDGGILQLASGERYVLVVYTALPSTPEVDGRFAAFMTALRPYLIAGATAPASR